LTGQPGCLRASSKQDVLEWHLQVDDVYNRGSDIASIALCDTHLLTNLQCSLMTTSSPEMKAPVPAGQSIQSSILTNARGWLVLCSVDYSTDATYALLIDMLPADDAMICMVLRPLTGKGGSHMPTGRDRSHQLLIYFHMSKLPQLTCRRAA
jgi:hypothetical protein